MRQQDLNLSFIRASAVIFVIAVHFFLNCGFYDIPSTGYIMMIGIFVRTQLMVCVPLFLLLSGYLHVGKSWNPSHYKKLMGFLVTYALASIFCAIYRVIFYHSSCSPLEWIKGIFSFTLAPYAWYIELYIGLFLLIPFLNATWCSLPTKRIKTFLVLTVFFLSIAPSINSLSTPFGWKLVPERWEALYPIAYYFTGCYLREFQTQRKWELLIFLDFVSVLLGSLLHIHQAGGDPFGYFVLTYWNGICTFISSICVFLILKSVPLNSSPKYIQQLAKIISSYSLPIFLVSWVPDQIFYSVLNASIDTVQKRFSWFVIMVFLVLLCSICISHIILRFQTYLNNITKQLVRRGRL